MLAKRLGAVSKRDCTQTLNVVQNNGEAAGQICFAFSYASDSALQRDTVNVGWKPGHLTDEDRDEVLKLFQK